MTTQRQEEIVPGLSYPVQINAAVKDNGDIEYRCTAELDDSADDSKFPTGAGKTVEEAFNSLSTIMRGKTKFES